MGTYFVKYTNEKGKSGGKYPAITTTALTKFEPSILGLKNISNKGDISESLAVIFDLEGFTEFCNQIDPHLVVPEYLQKYLTWIFKKIAEEFTSEVIANRVLLWNPLPFYAKFLGDGILFLWDTSGCTLTEIGNIAINMDIICQTYKSEFLTSISSEISDPPKKLRCGIARGQIIAIGNKDDYVGSCINYASRLQKLSKLSIAISRRGFNPNDCFGDDGSKGPAGRH